MMSKNHGIDECCCGAFLLHHTVYAEGSDANHSETYPVTTHVRWWGNPANKPLICLHGFMQSGASWQTCAQQLAQHYFVLAPDLIGHGQTRAPLCKEAFTMQAHVQQLYAIVYALSFIPECRSLEFLQLECAAETTCQPTADAVPNVAFSGLLTIPSVTVPVFTEPEPLLKVATRGDAYCNPIIYGYSMGGRVAATYAVKYCYTLGALVLESAGLGPATAQERQAYERNNAARVWQLQTQTLLQFVDEWEQLPLFATQTELPLQTQNAIRAERLANNAEALALSLEYAGQHCMDDLRTDLECIAVPTLYVAGTRDAKYCNKIQTLQRAYQAQRSACCPLPHEGPSVPRLHEDAQQMAQCAGSAEQGVLQHERARFAYIDAGHNVHLEAPAQLCKCVMRFLETEGNRNERIPLG